MVYVKFLLAVFLLLAIARTGYAQDVGVIVAALPDEQAECRYLAQKVKTQNEAITTVRKSTNIQIASMRKVLKLPRGSPQQREQLKLVKLIEAQNNTVGNASLRAQADVKTVKEVIQAKRGSLEQCDKFVSQIPPSEEIAIPKE